jgi:trimethylamine--corrinoid protein Co-methyltransferase
LGFDEDAAADGGAAMSGTDAPRRRRDRTSGRDRSATVPQRPWGQPLMRFEHPRAVSDDELDVIHATSLDILEQVGMEVLDPEARSIYREAGCSVDEATMRVRFPGDVVERAVATAPSSFVLHSRNPEHHLVIGGRHLAFGTVCSTPNYVTRAGVRRQGERNGMQDLLKVAQSLNIIHLVSGYPVEPTDIHFSVRHLEASWDILTLTDKGLPCYSLGRQRNRDLLELARISRGIDDATLQREPSVITIVNTNSPLRLDTPMSQGMIEFARNGQAVVVTPFTLAGAMAPITLAGAVAQQNAEALAGIALTQLVRPGAPAVYGGMTSNVDMQSGAPAFGTPEYAVAGLISGQLARRYGLPYRSSNPCTANALDAQAAYETMLALWGIVMGGVNFVMHAAGWMEGGLQSSLDKMLLDAEMLQMVAAMLDPLDLSDDAMPIDTIEEVGPGGHFFGTAHTQARFRTAFHRPMLSDWRTWESWTEAGRPSFGSRTHDTVDRFLAAYEPPPMDPDIRDELRAFIDRRVGEGGVATDY